MHTHAIQLLLHFRSKESRTKTEEAFINDLKELAEKHGLSFDGCQSMTLQGDEYHIAPCGKCGHLTIDAKDVKGGIDNMLPDFWFYIRRGRVSSDTARCDLCDQI